LGGQFAAHIGRMNFLCQLLLENGEVTPLSMLNTHNVNNEVAVRNNEVVCKVRGQIVGWHRHGLEKYIRIVDHVSSSSLLVMASTLHIVADFVTVVTYNEQCDEFDLTFDEADCGMNVEVVGVMRRNPNIIHDEGDAFVMDAYVLRLMD
jgi:hypothetical protein